MDDEDGYEDEQGLYGSLYFGKVDNVCVVQDSSSLDEFELEDFEDYRMDTDELERLAVTPYLLRIRLSDDGGCELQIHARMTEDYLDIERGMPVAAVLLSRSTTLFQIALPD
jgi:hypothetical protein